MKDILLEITKELSHKEQRNDVIYVTDIVNHCLREKYYARKTGLYKDVMSTILLVGHAFHKFLQEYLVRKGYEVEKEIRYRYEDIEIHGRVDAIHPEEKILVEIKTTNRPVEEPYESHIYQIQLYERFLGEEYDKRIWYIGRNTHYFKEFIIDESMDDETFKKMLRRAYTLHIYLETDILPEKEESYLCNYCLYRMLCTTNTVL